MSDRRMMEFRIRGMDCVEEVILLKRALGPLVGGEEQLSFDVLNGKMRVSEASRVSRQAIVEAVARTGLRAEDWKDEGEASAAPTAWWKRSRTVLPGVSGLLMLAGFLVHGFVAGSFASAMGTDGLAPDPGGVPLASRALYGLAIVAGAWNVVPRAWLALRGRRADMNVLMTVAIVGALGLGEWFEAAAVAFLFAVALALEGWSVERARRAVAALLKLTPATAHLLLPEGSEREVAASEVAIGSLLIIKPGERIPLDGKVVRGASEVNQAPITGESAPVAKRPEDDVFAGTVNGSGAIEIRSTKAADDTTLARIIRMVGEAQSRRAPSERWVERFARIYTPSVMILALAVFVVPPLLFGQPWSSWLYQALVLLVIACPCALVISTPVSIVAALAAAARHGVLVKGGTHVESPSGLQAVAFDKTGTLTEGNPAVVEVVALGGLSDRELLEIASSLEVRSEHPLGGAILSFARSRGVTVVPADGFEAIPGKGASGSYKERTYWVGSHRYLEERKQESPELHARLQQMSRNGRSVVVVGNDDQVCGLIALADPLRAGAAAAVADLRRAGVRHLVMLTGDNQETAAAIAGAAGIDEVLAELLPEEKVATIEQLVAKYQSVAMVGDGINDAPAMGRATLGIAMGAAGSDAAIEAADVALMSDDLSKVSWLVWHSRRALRVVRQNIAFALGVKAFFVILTFSGHASLWSAIAADMGASMLVIFNALRLLNAPGGHAA